MEAGAVKTTGRMLWILGGSFLVVDAIYLFWSLIANNLEIIGLITIGLSGVLCVLLAFYFTRAVRAGGPKPWPEDRTDAEIDDGDPEIGFFNPYSWWPILLAAACSLVFLGLAVSPWIWMFSVPFVAVSLVGWVFENYRGVYTH